VLTTAHREERDLYDAVLGDLPGGAPAPATVTAPAYDLLDRPEAMAAIRRFQALVERAGSFAKELPAAKAAAALLVDTLIDLNPALA
jgi:hypothetical protein